MALPNNKYIASTSLEEYFVDKSSGLPLANGGVYFYRDVARTQPKLVYQLTGDPNAIGGYNFVSLGNFVRLSATGTFVDNAGNNIAIYYFPYDGDETTTTNTLDLYYISVVDSSNAVQFTRGAWPPIAEEVSSNNVANVYVNQISNSQFVDVFFDKLNVANFQFAGAGSFVFPMAPDWDLVVISTGAGSVTVTRNLIAGNATLLTKPPYTLTVVPGNNITTLALRQRLKNNPGIWAQINGANNGYISGSILLAPNSQITMTYVPQTGTQKTILNKNNTTGTAQVYNNTVQLDASTNGSNSATGYSDIYLYMPSTGVGTTFSSVQVVGLADNQAIVPYVQEPVNRQMDHLFHYYNSLLQFKPIKSYLTGWDFPLNPAQFGTTGNVVGAAKKSQYAWDQTLIYTSATTGVGYTANPNTGALRITATNGATQPAVIQYLDQTQARALLNNDLSVNVSGITNVLAGITCTVTLWYTTDANLPNAADPTNLSIVKDLTANGDITGFNGNWARVSRTLAGSTPATFTLSPITAGTNYVNVGFSGWGANNAGANTATYFAIVVGFASLPTNNYIELNSISLVPGRIPTIPAPQTQNDVLRDCQHYYAQSYPQASLVGTATDLGQRTALGFVTSGSLGRLASFEVQYPQPMRAVPNMTFYPTYNPGGGGAIIAGNISIFYQKPGGGVPQAAIISAGPILPITYWDTTSIIGSTSVVGAFYRMNAFFFQAEGTGVGETFMAYQFIADARLGIV